MNVTMIGLTEQTMQIPDCSLLGLQCGRHSSGNIWVGVGISPDSANLPVVQDAGYSFWQKYAGHKKAVSYVVYMNNAELVSASTDSSLRLWSIGDGKAVRKYAGHVNEKNFVGLSADGDFVACGSETSQVRCGFFTERRRGGCQNRRRLRACDHLPERGKSGQTMV